MIYKFCPREIGAGYVEISGDRSDALREARENAGAYQLYADTRLTGAIMIHCIEYRTDGGREIPQAALYFDREAGFIWIGLH